MSRSAGKRKQNIDYNTADGVEVLSYAEQVQECFMELYNELDIANAPEKRKNEIIDSLWIEIYNKVFRPTTPQTNNCGSKLAPWKVEELEAVCDMYITLCKRFGGVIKYYQFCKLVGYTRYTIDLWHKANTSHKSVFIMSDSDIEEERKANTNIYIVNHVNDIKDMDIVQIKNNVYIDDIKANNAQERDILSCRRLDVKQKLNAEMQDSNTNQLSNDTMGAAIRANNEEELGKLYEPKRMIQHEQIKQALSLNDLKLLDNSTNTSNDLLLDINGTDVHGKNE